MPSITTPSSAVNPWATRRWSTTSIPSGTVTSAQSMPAVKTSICEGGRGVAGIGRVQVGRQLAEAFPAGGLPDHERPSRSSPPPASPARGSGRARSCGRCRRGRRPAWPSRPSWRSRPGRRSSALASPRHSACHWPPPNGGPSHQAMRPVWLKIAAAPAGQPGSVTGLLPSPPVINANASRGATTARMVISRPVVILVMVSPGSARRATPRINGRKPNSLGRLWLIVAKPVVGREVGTNRLALRGCRRSSPRCSGRRFPAGPLPPRIAHPLPRDADASMRPLAGRRDRPPRRSTPASVAKKPPPNAAVSFSPGGMTAASARWSGRSGRSPKDAKKRSETPNSAPSSAGRISASIGHGGGADPTGSGPGRAQASDSRARLDRLPDPGFDGHRRLETADREGEVQTMGKSRCGPSSFRPGGSGRIPSSRETV